MFHFTRPSDFVRRTLALAAVLSAGVAVAGAQTSTANSGSPVTGTNAAPALNLQIPAVDTSSDSLFSSSNSSSDLDTVAANSDHLPALNAMQYGGGGGRYGRPRYRGGNTNQDGSSKYIFFGGAGFTQPLGNTYHYLTPSYGFQIGGGRQFSKHIAVPIQFDYDHFGFNARTLSGQAYIYSGDANAADNGIDGSSHIWSFTVDPTYTFYSGEGLGAYAVVGVGFYHKVADFTAPQEEEFFDPIFGVEEAEVQGDIDHYTSNAVGFNGGFGLTYKLSRFSGERLYGEVRYVFVDNQQRQGYTANTIGSAPLTATNFYPANSNRTTFLPVKVGIRF